MAKYYVSCPSTFEETTFDSLEEAKAWVDERNEREPPAPGQPPAQVFTEHDWETLHAPDAG